MTNDHDELVSAYIDGQATAEEVALVESDPELLAEAEAMLSLTGRLASEWPVAPPEQRARQIGAALAAFDEGAGANGRILATEPDPGIGPAAGGPEANATDLGQRREDRGRARGRTSGRDRMEPARAPGPRRRGQGLPAWLGAAAAAVLLVGGLGWAIRAADDGIDEEVASIPASEPGDADTDGAAGADAAVEAEAAPAERSTLAADEAVADEAAEEAATESLDPADPASAGDAPAGGEADTSEEAAGSAAGAGEGFFPGEDVEDARLLLDTVPDQAAIGQHLAQGYFGPDLSACGPEITPPPGAALLGFMPISIDGQNGEILVFDTPAGQETLVVLGAGGDGPSCEVVG